MADSTRTNGHRRPSGPSALLSGAVMPDGPADGPPPAPGPNPGPSAELSGARPGGPSRRIAWTAAELLSAEFPPPRWAVPGVLAEGVNLLAGPPKVGKSWLALALAVVLLNGCARSADQGNMAAEPADAASAGHDGWWCAEHAVPEEVCTRCHANLVAGFKDKGDWCKEHDLPESQCFVCHPDREGAFAAQYEAKYGRKPPEPVETGEESHHDHNHES